MQNGKILVIDIETEPALSYHWGMFRQNIAPVQVKKDPAILCFAAKWFGQSEIFDYSVWNDGRIEMLTKARELLSEADAVVTKNGDSFDLAWFNTEWAKYDIPALPKLTSIDLEKTIRYKFRFLSNKLEYVAPYLGVGKKVKHEGFELWIKVMNGDEVAQRKMLRYCRGDVRVTDGLYRKIRPFITNHPHMGNIPGRYCGACGSSHVHVSKYRRTKTMRIQQLHCQNCGSYFDGTREKVKVE